MILAYTASAALFAVIGYECLRAARIEREVMGTPRFVRYTRNGGLRFLRIGRLQFSFCMVRK